MSELLPNNPAQAQAKTFPQRLREAREQGNQTTEVMAVLLNIPHEEYLLLESGSYPDDQTLRRICMLLSWNYYETQRLLINEMIAPNPERLQSADESSKSSGEAAQQPAISGKAPRPAIKLETLGSRMRDVRLETGQVEDVIAMLLNIDISTYRELESGQAPSDELLRKISTVYRWNYQELQSLLRTEHAQRFQPLQTGTPFPDAIAALSRLREICEEISALYATQSDEAQKRVYAQLELIRDTLRKETGNS